MAEEPVIYPVEQSDRDFAASRLQSNQSGAWKIKIQRGDCDNSYWVQTFAAHRAYLESLKCE